jgi:hypothetical protein
MRAEKVVGPGAEPGANNTSHPHRQDQAADAVQSNGDGHRVASTEDFSAEIEALLAKKNAQRNGAQPPKDYPEPPQDLDNDGADSPPGDDAAQDEEQLLGAVPKGPEARPRIWDATKLKPAEQPRWLAKSRLPRAALTLLLGDEGIGKSLFWALLITHISTGKAFEGFGMPDREPGLVVLVLTEDDWSTDVLPRLKVLGADLNMVKVFCTEDDGSGSPVFPRDIHIIEAMDPSPVLVVVDCWLDTVPPGKKIADPQQARSVLHPWKEMATRTDAAVMLLGHTNRIASANARAKYGATYALRQKCRLTLFAQEGQDGELLIGPEKANGAAILPASIFTVDTEQFFDPTPEHDGKVPFLTYEGQSDKTARQHLEDNFAADQDTGQKTTAMVWLALFLSTGPRWSNDVHHVRKLKGISEKAFKTAKRKLNVESVKTGDDWFMRLPNHADRIPEGPPEFQEVPQEVPDVPSNSEGTSSDLPRSEGTSSDSSPNEGTSCQEDPQEVPSKTKKSPSSCEDNKKSLLTDIQPKGTSWNFL